jgi:tetratricopeptide (TPR) repeat protein
MKENYPLTVTWQEKALDLSNSQGIQAHTYWDMAFTDYLYGKKDHALEMLGRSKEAANKTNNSLFDIGFYYLQAYFYLDLGQYGKARELYHTFMNIALTEPSTTPQDDSTGFYLFRGLVQIQLNRLDSAAMNVERIKAQSSDQATVWNWQYLVREIQIASAEGQEDLDKIALLEQPVPNFQSPWVLVYNLPYMRNSLAEAYHRFGLTDKAIAEYERMITFDPASNDRHLINPRYHYYLGILYQEKEMKEKAAEQFRKFLYLWQDADDVFPEPADALQRLKSMEEGKS